MKVFVHIDADPDNDSDVILSSLRQRNTPGLIWDGLASAISTFATFKETMQNSGFRFKAVFFLRADEQIRTAYGSFSHIFSDFYDDIRQSFAVGWHPHLLRWSEHQRIWSQECRDDNWIQTMLTDSYDELRAQGYQTEHTKMGWCFHNNVSMRTLSDIGIAADFSALPGARSPGRSVGGLSFQDRFDWCRTKPYPYRPSGSDYQNPGDLRITEIPLTMYEIRGLKEFMFMTKIGMPFYRRLDFSYLPSLRRMVPVYLPNLANIRDLKSFCESLIQSCKQYITLYLHPKNLIDPNSKNVFESFILQILSATEEYGMRGSFADASDLCTLQASD